MANNSSQPLHSHSVPLIKPPSNLDKEVLLRNLSLELATGVIRVWLSKNEVYKDDLVKTVQDLTNDLINLYRSPRLG